MIWIFPSPARLRDLAAVWLVHKCLDPDGEIHFTDEEECPTGTLVDQEQPFTALVTEYRLYDLALERMSEIVEAMPEGTECVRTGTGQELTAILHGAKVWSDSDVEWAARSEQVFEYLYQFALAQAGLNQTVPLEE